MSLKIQQIKIKDFGPIEHFDHQFSDINLVYSKNEGGKSFLVEFIIKSLFANTNQWKSLRDINIKTAKGNEILISGVNGSTISLNPKTRKIEKLDVIFNNNIGISSNLSKLLIVKSGEVEIAENSSAGINKNFIKEILSNRPILNLIDDDKNISSTIKNCTLHFEDKKIISINKKGEGATYEELQDKITKINEKINELQSKYNLSEIHRLEQELESWSDKKEQQIKAKRYKAYKLSNEINILQQQIDAIPVDKINELQDLIKNYKDLKKQIYKLELDIKDLSKKTENLPIIQQNYKDQLNAKRYYAYTLNKQIKETENKLNFISIDEINKLENSIDKYRENISTKEQLEEDIKDLEIKTKHYDWLSSLRTRQAEYLQSNIAPNKVNMIYLVISLITIFTGFVTLFVTKNSIISGIFFIIGIGLGGFYIYKLQKHYKNLRHAEETNAVREEFKERFGTELNAVTIEEKYYSITKDYLALENKKDEFNKINTTINSLKTEINTSINNIFGQNIEESEWYDKIRDKKIEIKELNDKLNELNNKLSSLNVDETDYVNVDNGIKYSKDELNNLEKEIAKLEPLLEEKNQKEEQLKILMKNCNEALNEIKNKIKIIFNADIEESEWESKISEIIDEYTNLKNKKSKKEGELEGLGIHESNYLADDPGVEYSPMTLQEIEKAIEKIEQKINDEKKTNEYFKHEICQLIDKDFTIEWNDLIEALYNKREEFLFDLHNIEAKIIAGKLVHETINEIQKVDDEKLLDAINSDRFKKLLKDLTLNYEELYFEDNEGKNFDEIKIYGDKGEFYLKDLSTGTKEQVLFALRVTLAEKILGDKAFFILDDAFQHSDYDRRPRLIDQLFTLANEGWQIIYLTMDDNIRELFKYQSVSSHNFQEIIL
jgi:DNA repair exonuclease SbcCD ATPase subunit